MEMIEQIVVFIKYGAVRIYALHGRYTAVGPCETLVPTQ